MWYKAINQIATSHLSHLNEHKFKHGFNETINRICICGGDIESIDHFFLHCP